MNSLLEKRRALIVLVARYRATNVRVFGSVARGDDTHKSDIDLLVDMPDDASLYDLIKMPMEIEALLGRRADVLTESGLSIPTCAIVFWSKRDLCEKRPTSLFAPSR